MTGSAAASQAVVMETGTKGRESPKEGPGWFGRNWRAVLAEIVATMLLIVIGCMSCIDVHPASALYVPLCFGLVITFNVQIFGPLSGAHMNPVVTIASVLWGNTSIGLGFTYAAAQCAGAILGYGILYAVSPVDLATEGVCVTVVHSGLNVYQAVVVEAFLTMLLILLCCSFWNGGGGAQESAAIKFGLAVTGLSLAGGVLTGASMNPARSLGPALWTNVWAHHWVYWAGPALGGAFATMLYRTVWRNKKDQ